MARLRRRWERGKVRLYRELVGAGPRRILDVGCGDGRFLEILRDFGAPDWQLVGIDIDAGRRGGLPRARLRGPRRARRGSSASPQATFDAVVMLQLIEHVEDPVAICARVFALLRPGGIFIVETPNLAGLDYRLFRGRCWGHYHFPRHWNLFSTASLQRMLTRAGFEIARSESLISTSSLDDLAPQLLPRSRLARTGSCASSTTRTRCCSRSSCVLDALRARLGLRDLEPARDREKTGRLKAYSSTKVFGGGARAGRA